MRRSSRVGLTSSRISSWVFLSSLDVIIAFKAAAEAKSPAAAAQGSMLKTDHKLTKSIPNLYNW